MQVPQSLFALSFAVASAAGQCPFQSVGVQSYGQGCNSVFSILPTLAFALDTAACQLAATVNAFNGCCNTYWVGSLLVLGDQPAAVPLPQFGLNCELLAAPIILLFQPNPGGSTFNLTLPPALPPLTFYAQGSALYFTTIGLTYDFALTAGSQVTLL